MKYVFLTMWWLFLLLLGPASLMTVWHSPLDWRSYLFLGLVAYILLCTWQLIREGYRVIAVMGPSTVGFWLFLLLLPINLMPLHAAYETWSRGVYVADVSSGRSRWIGELLVLLQELFGHWAPISLMLAVGIGGSLAMLFVAYSHRR